MSTLRVSRSRTYPVDPARAFDLVLPMPLNTIFARGFGPLPPIRDTEQDGVWGTVGQVRTINLVGPGTMRETLTEVSPPDRFTYVITDLTGPMSAIAEGVEGEWRFEPAGTGVRITWSWAVEPRGAVGRLAMPVLGRLWVGYAGRALETLDAQLVGA